MAANLALLQSAAQANFSNPERSPGAIVVCRAATGSNRADFVRVLLQRPRCFLGWGHLVVCHFPDASDGVCRHTGGTFIYLIRVA